MKKILIMVSALLLVASMLVSCAGPIKDPIDSSEIKESETETDPGTDTPPGDDNGNIEPEDPTPEPEPEPEPEPGMFDPPADASIYSGTPDTSWFTGDKSEYVLTTADQLAGLNKIRQDSVGETTFAGITIKLGANMIFNKGTMDEIVAKGEENTPFPAVNSTYLFKGTFDGQGYTVSGVFVKPGGSGKKAMLGSIGGNAVVKNLRVINSYVSGPTAKDKTTLATLIARVSGDTSSVTISNVEVHSTIKELDYPVNNVGGFIGDISDAAHVTIKNCNYYGSIETSGRSAGGFIGAAINTHATVSVSSCENHGNVTALTDAGGIIGTSAVLSLNPSNLSNDGKITASTSAGELFGYKTDAVDPKNGIRPHGTSMRVMSFNVQSDFDSFSTAGTERLNALRQEILFYAPDFIGFQEDSKDFINKLELSGYKRISPSTLGSSGNCSIFYKSSLTLKKSGTKYLTSDGTSSTVALTAKDLTTEGSKYQLTSAELSELKITSSTNMKNLKTSEGNAMLSTKLMTYGVFEISSKPVIFVNLHLQHRSQNATYSTPAVQKLRLMERLKQLSYAEAQIEALKKTYPTAEVFITGDFNDLVGSDTYLEMKNTYGYSSAHETAVLKYGVSATWNNAFKLSNQGNSYPSVADRSSNSMLDFCFLSSGLSAIKFRVVAGCAPISYQKQRYTSDHLPIITDIHFGATAPAIKAPSVYSGTPDKSWYTGDKTQYILSTADQLMGMNALRAESEGTVTFEGVAIRLDADMIINQGTLQEIISSDSKIQWPALNSAHVFKGIFDGRGHSISGVYQVATSSYRGMFGGVAGSATIKNFVLENSYFTGATQESKSSLGCIIARINDANADVHITNVTVADSVLMQENTYTMKYVGGFVGKLQAGKLTLTNCHFNGTINFPKGTYLAGFVGMADGTLILNNCHGTGTVSGDNYIAGLAGFSANTTKTNNNSCLTGAIIYKGSNHNASFIKLS